MTMLEALRRDLQAEEEARQAEGEMRATAQDRCAAAEQQASKLEWDFNQGAASLQTKVSPAEHSMETERLKICPLADLACSNMKST